MILKEANLARVYERGLSEGSDIRVPPNAPRLRLLARLLGTPPSEANFIVEELTRCATVAGHMCEFGVARGETSALIANEIRSTGKLLHLFDSFEGLPETASLAYLDFDLYEPITVTLEFLDSVTPNGAVVIVDDYDRFSTGVKTAVDELLGEKNRGSITYESLMPPPEYGRFAVLTKRG